MLKILEDLYQEIAHGDEEHRKWLWDKMEEFSNKTIQNMSEQPQTEKRQLTFGEDLVGLTFNPSGMTEVDKVKKIFAEMADMVESSKHGDPTYTFNLLRGDAIREILHAQMAVVKFLTYKNK